MSIRVMTSDYRESGDILSLAVGLLESSEESLDKINKMDSVSFLSYCKMWWYLIHAIATGLTGLVLLATGLLIFLACVVYLVGITVFMIALAVGCLLDTFFG